MITILTPSYNRAKMIETAIQSVIDQNYPEIEHIIVDGGSADGTLNVLKKYHYLRVVSEPDQGMYDALNKGLSMATGEIIGFLNSDDFYAPNVFAQIAGLFEKENIDAVAGLAAVVQQTTENSHNSVLLHPGKGEALIRHITLEAPIFNAYFFSKRVFQKIGAFNAQYKIAADRDFMLRFVLASFNTAYIDQPVYYYLQHPGSMTMDYCGARFGDTVDEHLMISHAYLASQKRFSHRLLESLVELRTRDTIRACAHCLRHKELDKAWFYILEGFRYQPLWGFRFIKHAITHPIRQKIGLPYRFP